MIEDARPSLRERKFAKTRLALAEAATNHLEVAAFETLSVKALCDRVQISEATFFNYFPRKEDLIVYLDRLWTLELNWYGKQASEQQQGLAVIDSMFRYTAIQIQKKPGLMGEIIAYEARSRERHTDSHGWHGIDLLRRTPGNATWKCSGYWCHVPAATGDTVGRFAGRRRLRC